jgi:hypothetical protein
VYFSTRHHLVPVAGLVLFSALAFAALLDRIGARREALVAAGWLAAAAALLLPPSLLTSFEYRAASRSVARIRGEVEQRTRDLPDGSAVLLGNVPQLVLPPFYFGWALVSSLRAPFSESDVATRLRIVNLRNRELTQTKAPPPAAFDRTLDFASADPPHWIRLRYRQRQLRDLGLVVDQGAEQPWGGGRGFGLRR